MALLVSPQLLESPLTNAFSNDASYFQSFPNHSRTAIPKTGDSSIPERQEQMKLMEIRRLIALPLATFLGDERSQCKPAR